MPLPSLICFSPRPHARARLLCLPFAGGSASAFRNFADASPLVEVYATQLPARGPRLREAPYTSLQDALAGIEDELVPLQKQDRVPWIFFGYSMGALLAFTLAQRAVADQRAPLHLFVAARAAPHIPLRGARANAFTDIELAHELIRTNAAPHDLLSNVELREALLPALRADLQINESSVDATPLPLPISVYAGSEDRSVTPADIDAWAALTTSEFEVEWFDGDHMFMKTTEASLLRVVGTRIGTILKEAG